MLSIIITSLPKTNGNHRSQSLEISKTDTWEYIFHRISSIINISTRYIILYYRIDEKIFSIDNYTKHIQNYSPYSLVLEKKVIFFKFKFNKYIDKIHLNEFYQYISNTLIEPKKREKVLWDTVYYIIEELQYKPIIFEYCYTIIENDILIKSITNEKDKIYMMLYHHIIKYKNIQREKNMINECNQLIDKIEEKITV